MSSDGTGKSALWLMAGYLSVAPIQACERGASRGGAPAPASSDGAAERAVSTRGLPSAALPPPARGFQLPWAAPARDASAPAKRYANLSSAACRAEARRRELPLIPAKGKTSGLETPLVISGPLGGIVFELPRSIYGFVDCRLVLLLHDMAADLASFGVVAVEVNNIYRPSSALSPEPTTPPRKPEKGPAPKAVQRSKRSPPKKTRAPPAPKPPPAPVRLSQHALGLAIDITEFRLKDGRTLNVERDWHGALGVPPCGPASEVRGGDPLGVLLRDLTCALARAGYCNHLITPNRDEAHHNHIHCDIEAGASEVTVE